jgi:hypothetical protein
MRAAVAALVLLAACAPPPSRVPVGPDAYMVPIAGGDTRCVAYRLESPTQATVQALFYRKADGTFTMSRVEA